MSATLSLDEARKLSLYSQRLSSRSSFGGGADATLGAIEHLGYVQIDTLSIVARAHLHTLWNRLHSFRPRHIDKLQREGKIFEHWAHALALLPMRDYRYSLPMMHRIAAGDRHWQPKNNKETRKVLERIRTEGPLSARDFDDQKTSNAMWARSPSKMALEQLFIEGELMVPYRMNFQKVYDLRERVLPADVDTSVPNEEELCRHLIDSCLRAHGLAQLQEMSYLRKGLGRAIRRVALQMEEDGLLQRIHVDGQQYFSTPPILDSLNEKLPRSGLRILSPFDNAIIQRKRVNALFEFDYQIECYVPKSKRKYGYFCLPLLHRNRLVGRLDAKADRKNKTLHLLHLQLEDSIGDPTTFYNALLSELIKYSQFNGCEQMALQRLSGSDQLPNWA